MSLILRYMLVPDIPQVVQIDRLSFDLPWSDRSYYYEVTESGYSHMVVLELLDDSPSASSGWRRWLPRLNGSSRRFGNILGYGGLWNIGSEAHISTIAVHPDWRGQGYGEILLAGMVSKALTLQAGFVVLEVRVSNTRAQSLYQKYDFRAVSVRPRYYRNNDEDAYEMHLALDSVAARARFDNRVAALRRRLPYTDQYTAFPAPKG